MSSSWALFIMIMLLMFALFTSYILQQKKIQAVHETVLSIFAGTLISPEKAGILHAFPKAWPCQRDCANWIGDADVD